MARLEGRSVLIELGGGKRKYTFTGNWNGNDVSLVLRSFFRAYKLHMRELRKEAKKAELVEASITQGGEV